MTHFSKLSIWVVVALGLSTLFYACSQEDFDDASQTATNEDFSIRVKNGYLEFKDQATYDKVIASLADADQAALGTWESQFPGFTSLRSIYHQAAIEQDAWFDQLQNMDKEDLLSLMKHNDDFWYADYVLQHAKSLVLEDSGYFELNIPSIEVQHATFVNENGLIKIGESLIKYQKDNVYAILDGDEKKLSSLETLEKSDFKAGILITSYYEEKIRITNNARFRNEANCTGYTGGGGQRVRGYVIRGHIRRNNPNSTGLSDIFQYKPYVDIKAYNDINRGWPLGWGGKLTNELRFYVDDLDIGYNPLDGQPGVSVNNLNFFVNSYGNNVKDISHRAWTSPIWGLNFFCEVAGDITFVGRHGSRCTLIE